MAIKENSGGKFRKKENPFSQVSNFALRDNGLSLKAKGLYALIESYIHIPGFTVYKATLCKNCMEGKAAFDGAWKELKDKGYLIQYKIVTPNGYLYEYELLDKPLSQDTENQGVGFQDIENQPLGNKSVENQPLDNSMIEKPCNLSKNNFNNIDFNNNEFNHIYLTNDLKDESEHSSVHLTIRESILQNKTYLYSYADFIEFSKNQIEFDDIYPFAIYATDKNRYSAAMEWVYLMAEIYSCEEEYIVFSNRKEKTLNAKQKLLCLTKDNLIGIFSNFQNLTGVSNVKQYMIASLLNHYTNSGFTSLSLERIA